MACEAAGRDFSSPSLITQPLGLSFGFDPTSACEPPSGDCSTWVGHACLLRQEKVKMAMTGALMFASMWSPSSAYRVRAWCLGRESTMVPPPLARHSTMVPHFQSRTLLPPGESPAVELLTPFPSGCLWAANSNLLPGSAFLTPCFNTQTLPSLADTCLRQGTQGWLPRRLWQGQHGACHWGGYDRGGVQAPGACMGIGILGLRDWWACSDGCPSQCPRRQVPECGKGGCKGGSTLGCHSTMVPCFYGGPGFFRKISLSLNSLLLSLEAVSSQPTAAPGDTRLRLGCAVLQHRPYTQVLLCLAFQRPVAAFPSNPLKLPLCPSRFPHHEGTGLSVGTSPHLQLPSRDAGPFPFLTFFFFFLSSYLVVWGFFLSF